MTFLGKLRAKILAHPFVYEKVRPFAVGGIDMSPSYSALRLGPTSVVMDVGCGTGDALRYLPSIGGYHGFDTDPIALQHAQRRADARGMTDAHFHSRIVAQADFDAIAPTALILSGILHHLNNDDALALLGMAASTPRLEQIVTQDVVFIHGELLNNVFATYDRGEFVRDESGYQALVEKAGLRIVRSQIAPCGGKSGRMLFLFMELAR